MPNEGHGSEDPLVLSDEELEECMRELDVIELGVTQRQLREVQGELLASHLLSGRKPTPQTPTSSIIAERRAKRCAGQAEIDARTLCERRDNERRYYLRRS